MKERCSEFKNSKVVSSFIDKELTSHKNIESYASRLRKSKRNDVFNEKRLILIPARSSFKPTKALIDFIPAFGSDTTLVLQFNINIE